MGFLIGSQGVSLLHSPPRTGTIIGSAVFNVLFVIGACAIAAPEPLKLTWCEPQIDSKGPKGVHSGQNVMVNQSIMRLVH